MAVTVLKNISQDEINWYHETRYWMHVSDEKTMINAAKREGKAEGLEEGKQKAIIEMVRNAKAAKLPVEQIAVITKLSVAEIQKINQYNKNEGYPFGQPSSINGVFTYTVTPNLFRGLFKRS